MRVFITGGTGFVGTSLTRKLALQGHQVTVLDRAIGSAMAVPTLPLHVPGFLMKLILGEFGTVLLEGQKVIPGRLAKLGIPLHSPQSNQHCKTF